MREGIYTDYRILVNREKRLLEDWEKRIELVDVHTGLNETFRVEKKTAEAYEKLKAALAEEEIVIELDSAYRSLEEQQRIYADFLVNTALDLSQRFIAKIDPAAGYIPAHEEERFAGFQNYRFFSH